MSLNFIAIVVVTQNYFPIKLSTSSIMSFAHDLIAKKRLM